MRFRVVSYYCQTKGMTSSQQARSENNDVITVPCKMKDDGLNKQIVLKVDRLLGHWVGVHAWSQGEESHR